MGAATEINKVSLTVEANRLIGGNAGNNLSFVFLANALKELYRLIAVPLFTSNAEIRLTSSVMRASIAPSLPG